MIADDNVDASRTATFDLQADAIVFWVQIFGPQAGDEEELRLVAPDGSVLVQKRRRIDRNGAQWISFIGKRRGEAWAEGSYRGEYVLYRGAERARVVGVVRERRVTSTAGGRGGD